MMSWDFREEGERTATTIEHKRSYAIHSGAGGRRVLPGNIPNGKTRERWAIGARDTTERLWQEGSGAAHYSYGAMSHFFYLARCSDGSLYAGSCVDLATREERHNAGKGAKYTRSRRPVQIIYSEEFATLAESRCREAEVKKWKKAEKERLVKGTR